jgi:hypothetical protein
MSKKKNAQKKLVNEIKNQLLIQAERLGVREHFGPVAAEEIKLDSVKKILTDFYMERSNLEYELNILGSNKKELLIKLERLNLYIRRAVTMHERHLRTYETLLEKGMGDIAGARKAANRIAPRKVRVSA